MQDPMRLKCI
jgi:hypothetical protein